MACVSVIAPLGNVGIHSLTFVGMCLSFRTFSWLAPLSCISFGHEFIIKVATWWMDKTQEDFSVPSNKIWWELLERSNLYDNKKKHNLTLPMKFNDFLESKLVVEMRVCFAIYKLAQGEKILMCLELFVIGKPTITLVLWEFVKTINI